MKAITVYGIPNCDQVRKTRRRLDERGLEYQFHDFRKDGVTAAQLKRWCAALGWETVLNKKGMSFRKLSDDEKQNLNQTRAIELMQRQPTLIKRPVVECGKRLFAGYSESELEHLTGG